MLLKTGGILNRIGLAKALISPQKIRMEEYGLREGLTHYIPVTQGKNYKITPQQKDELVKECQSLLEEKDFVPFEENSALRMVQIVKRMIHRNIARENPLLALRINRKDYPIDVFEISLGGECSTTGKLIIPLEDDISELMMKKRSIEPEVLKEFQKKGMSDNDILRLVENLRAQDPNVNLKEIAKEMI